MVQRITGPEEVNVGDSVISCEQCDQLWKTSGGGSYISGALFGKDHERHTGHRPNEPVPAEEYFEDTGTEQVVICDSCDQTWSMYDESEMEEFREQHQIHAGHEIDRIEERSPSSKTEETVEQ